MRRGVGRVSPYDGGGFGERLDGLAGLQQQLAVVQAQRQVVGRGGDRGSKAGEQRIRHVLHGAGS